MGLTKFRVLDVNCKLKKSPLNILYSINIIQGVATQGGHFATLCQEVDFYEAFFFIINFQKEKANTFTLLIILHSMATVNLKKSEEFVTNTTAASKYMPRRPRISIN